MTSTTKTAARGKEDRTVVRRPDRRSSAIALGHHYGMAISRKRDSIRWVRSAPFVLMQFTPLLVLAVGSSPIALAVAFAFWLVRMFAITGFYHRYFSHKSFKTSRWFQAVMAFWGGLAVQKGALWWAAHHRDHHRHSDMDEDIHSPVRHGFWWSHMGWIFASFSKPTQFEKVKELARFPELRFLNTHHWIPAVVGAVGMLLLGRALGTWAPESGTNGWQMLVWGFFVSTWVLYHTTYTINSFTHRFGTRRYATKDDSRNHWFFALVTLGEGWHNNHHYYPSSARMGFFWWEFDPTYWGLRVLERVGLIWDLRPVPEEVRKAGG